MASRETDEKFDWNKTWLAEMFMSGEESVKRAAEIDLLMGRTPEEKRLIEIKAGVITASVGVGIGVLLLVLMGGIIASGRVSDAAAEILSRLWIVGILPVMIGVALIINGVFISRRGREGEEIETGGLNRNFTPRPLCRTKPEGCPARRPAVTFPQLIRTNLPARR